MNGNPGSPVPDPNAETQPYLAESNSPTQPLRLDPNATRPLPNREAGPGSVAIPAAETQPYRPEETWQLPAPADPLSQFQAVRVPKQTQPRMAGPQIVPPPVFQPQIVQPQMVQPQVIIQPQANPASIPRPKKRRRGAPGCLFVLLLLLGLALAYFLAPLNTNLVVMGIDRPPQGTNTSRTDTIMLVSIHPLSGRVAMLSVPRDLWVAIPGVGENRINTAHFFAEASQPGSGPRALMSLIAQDFGFQAGSYVRLRFDGVTNIVDALGGVTVDLPQAAGGLSVGQHHLNGAQALAFVRDRKSSDDFFRMAHGQLMVEALIRQTLNPLTWLRAPQIAAAVLSTVDTNLPIWQWPRLGVALLRSVVTGAIDARTLDRTMATPFVTSGGAQVLRPHWDLIRPLVTEMFFRGLP